MNQYIGIGNIVKDLELRQTAGAGKSVCSFTIAINHGFGDKKQTDYVDCVAWDKAAESLCKYMGKGKKVAVTGRLTKRSYEAQDGSKRYVSEIVCSDIEYLSPMGEAKEKPQEQSGLFGDEQGDFEPFYDENPETKPF